MKFKILFLLVFILAACAPQPAAGPDELVSNGSGETPSTGEPAIHPLLPQPGDEDLSRGAAYTNEASVIIRESYPPQIALIVSGDLPTPCHQLRANIGEPDAENKIVVDLYTVTDPDKACVQVLEPFEETIELGTFPTGHYTVWVNDKVIGEFDA